MAPSRATTTATDFPVASDGEDDAPETFTLSQSKERAARLNEARQAAESDAKRRRKEKNRRRDETLKRRALETRGAGVGQLKSAPKADKQGTVVNASESSSKDEETRDLEARMERAMREAEEEQDVEGEGEESWGGPGDDVENSEYTGESDGSSHSSGNESNRESSSDDSMSGIEEHESDEDTSDLDPPNDPRLEYLPEHLFSEALSKAQVPSKKSSSVKPPLKRQPERKRKPATKRSTKDVIIGSKTIRTIAPKITPVTSAASRTLPPGKVKRFYEGHLNLKQNHTSKRRGAWDRRAANIGNMRSTTLPALHFCRNS